MYGYLCAGPNSASWMRQRQHRGGIIAQQPPPPPFPVCVCVSIENTCALGCSDMTAADSVRRCQADDTQNGCLSPAVPPPAKPDPITPGSEAVLSE